MFVVSVMTVVAVEVIVVVVGGGGGDDVGGFIDVVGTVMSATGLPGTIGSILKLIVRSL